MPLLIDYLPLILFFAAYKMYDIFTATAVAIAASVAQIVYLYFSRKKVGVVPWLSLALISIFGGATLLLHDETFLKWKPTALYITFAAVLIAGKLVWHRDLLRHVMKGIELPDRIWSTLTWMWAGFFLFLAVLNWFVAFHFSMDTWVNFKLFGTFVLILLFALAQGLFLARYVKETPDDHERI